MGVERSLQDERVCIQSIRAARHECSEAVTSLKRNASSLQLNKPIPYCVQLFFCPDWGNVGNSEELTDPMNILLHSLSISLHINVEF